MAQGAQRSWPWRKPERSAALMKSAGVSWPQVSGKSSTKVTFSYTFMRLEESHWFWRVWHWWVKFEFGTEAPFGFHLEHCLNAVIAGKNREHQRTFIFLQKVFCKGHWVLPQCSKAFMILVVLVLQCFVTALATTQRWMVTALGNPFGDLCHLMGSNISIHFGHKLDALGLKDKHSLWASQLLNTT